MSKSPRIGVDRFSSLPDEVAHKVVSFLSMEDISRLSVVWKRCRQLCISMSFLSLDVIPYRLNPFKLAQLMNYIERLLLLRRGMDTQDCHVRWCLDSSIEFVEEEYRVFSWLHNVVSCKLKRLVLDDTIKSGSDFVLPSSPFCGNSLESLTLTFSNGIGFLKIPLSISSTSGFSCLKYLKLEAVLLDESFGEWCFVLLQIPRRIISSNDKRIKEHHHQQSSLKTLDFSFPFDLVRLRVSAEKVEQMTLVWTFNFPNNRELQLSTPNLEIFAYLAELRIEKPIIIPFDRNLVHILRAVGGHIKALVLNDDSIL